jgi:hypothetical protein
VGVFDGCLNHISQHPSRSGGLFPTFDFWWGPITSLYRRPPNLLCGTGFDYLNHQNLLTLLALGNRTAVL